WRPNDHCGPSLWSISFADSPVVRRACRNSFRTCADLLERTAENVALWAPSAGVRAKKITVKSSAARLLRSGDKYSQRATPNTPRSAMTYPSLGPVKVESLRLAKTSSIGWRAWSCARDNASQSPEDKGLIDRSDDTNSRRLMTAIGSDKSSFSFR